MALEKNQKKVTVREIAEFFELEQLTGDKESLNRIVTVPDANRPGFELAGFYKPSDPKRVILIGKKEMQYIQTMTEEEQRTRFPYITDEGTPMIIMTRNFDAPQILKEIANNCNFPIFKSPEKTAIMMVDLISYLDEMLAKSQIVSGDFLVVNDKGVLLVGKSGMGKSATALSLIKHNQILVSDARVVLSRIHNNIIGSAPEIVAGFLELPGIGIIDIKHMFGANSITDKHTLDLIIELQHFDPSVEYNRVNDSTIQSTNILGLDIPSMILPINQGRSTQSLVESAVDFYTLTSEGYNSTRKFVEKSYALIDQERRK